MSKHFPTAPQSSGQTSLKNRKHLRRLKMLQRMGLFGKDTTSASYERAHAVADLRSAYSLVHDSFVTCGYINPRSSGLRVRPYETSADTATFVAKLKGTVVGVLSLVMDSGDLGLPSDKAYECELNAVRAPDATMAETSNLAILPEFRNTAVTSELMRCMYAHAVPAGCTDLVCSVSRWLVPIFESMGFDQIGEKKNYSESEQIVDPVILLRLPHVQTRWQKEIENGDLLHEFWREYHVVQNPYNREVNRWTTNADKTFNSPGLLSQLFAGCPELFKGETPERLAAIKKRLGPAYEMLAPKPHSSCYRQLRTSKRSDSSPPVHRGRLMTPTVSERSLTNIP